MKEIEELWDELLSREPDLIQSAFDSLQPDEKASILKHLSRMIDEEGWHPSQRISARAALAVLNNNQSQG